MENKSLSIWESTAANDIFFPELQGNREADVVVIGGGITGLTAALQLSDAGKTVIVLEAHRIGLGTTGNSTGNLYCTVDEHLSVIKKKWGADVMKTVVNSRFRAIDMIEINVKKYNIDCDFYRTSFNYFAEGLDDDIKDFIKAETDALTEAGLTVSENTHIGLPFEVHGAIKVEGQAQFNPLKYVRGLAKNLSGKCEIFEKSMVVDIDDKNGLVHTAHGTVKAKHIIMATHTPKGVYMVQTVLGPYREHGVAAELLSGEMPEGIFWSMNKPKHSVRVYKSEGKKYVMVIGDKYKTGQGDDTNEYVRKLEDYLRTHFNVGPTTHTWGGQQYTPADGLPYIGKHGESLYFLTGFATDGLVYGTLASMIVTDLILGKENIYEDTYKLSRVTPIKSFKEFFKENTDNMMQYLKDVPWTGEELSDIRPGEGKVIEAHGEKLAVYKDELGTKHVCSAVCTHMKCVVNWNSAEKSWDCPCHGSRFNFDGVVIEGPALVNLPAKKL
ncbi:MAG: dependent oxidoreductase family protein [Bacteroidota bacterium]|jgi:glycine/D-amino acid oxidase-like deaminating enzyme/nitrite reductase/ring-hydroxylating ferredoxin subunit|nr:dependent oxidoreductase family protein [Bacteroidota bacterium]